MVSDFDIKVDKLRVIDTVRSYYEIPSPDILESKFKNLEDVLYRLSRPKGVYINQIKDEVYDFESLKDCSHIVYCIVTIGEEVPKYTDYLFNNGEFFDGLLLDAMSSEMLFEVSSQFYLNIKSEIEKTGLGLTCKLSPGDGEIPITYQQNIFEKFDKNAVQGMYIFQGCLLYPVKSMSYLYGAGDKILSREKDHCCDVCSNGFCKMRKNVEHM
jgi:hypothetical protein